jgi:8-oxo-dGTP pyrophosphatase MutT (NUDIX family)
MSVRAVFSSMRKRKKSVETRIQYGALPYRRNDSARMEVMLVTSRETRRWIIPKGWPQKGRTPHRSAAREAYEEAGVVGRVHSDPLGSFSYEKRLPTGCIVCEVHVLRSRCGNGAENGPKSANAKSSGCLPDRSQKPLRNRCWRRSFDG